MHQEKTTFLEEKKNETTHPERMIASKNASNVNTTDKKAPKGNTNEFRCRKWVFTLNNYTEEEYIHINTEVKRKNWLYIIGKEEGKENKTPHLQGFIECKNAIKFSTLKNMMPRAHIEKSKGSKEQNYAYCSKENNFITNIKMKQIIKDPLEGLELYQWQKEVLKIINEKPCKRNIYWFWEPKGNVGKTELCKSICLKRSKETIFLGGKASDIKYGVKSFIDNPNNDLKICIFHFTRSLENHISYEAIESVKDGIFFNSKYESGMIIYDKPHVICFANFKPEKRKISKDRWIIRKIKDKKIVVI